MEMVLIAKNGKKFYVKDLSQDMHCQYGFIKSVELKKAKPGDVLKTNTGKELSVLKPEFLDVYRKIKRGAQIIPKKDVGVIVTVTGINSESRVVDAGAGSGGLACFLAHLVKEVITYDIRDDFLENVKHNKILLDLKNLTIKKADIYEKIDEKDVDLVTLDLPEPWKAVKNAEKALKIGGFIMSYSPCVPQVMDFVHEIRRNDSLLFIKTVEVIEREWEVDGRKVRPKTQTIGHSGFMSFARKIK